MISVMSSVGSPTDVNTITIVTSPAWGIPAAPMLAAVAVMLEGTGEYSYQQREEVVTVAKVSRTSSKSLSTKRFGSLSVSPSRMVTHGT